MLHEVRVTGTTVDPVTRSPFVVLKGLNEELTVAIWIGLNEANAIMLELEQVPTPRPMTHDLLKNILAAVEIPLQRVVITDVVDGTYYAILELKLGDRSSRLIAGHRTPLRLRCGRTRRSSSNPRSSRSNRNR